MSEVENSIKEIFLTVFPELNESTFSWENPQAEYENWDSFSQLNLITMLEEKFDISISDENSINIQSAEDVLNFVKGSN